MDEYEEIIYEENRKKVESDLKEGIVDYCDFSAWSFQDNFFAFLLGLNFFEICGSSYPSPRKKEEVALWFLLACKVQMKLNTTSSFSRLPGILKSGAILSRVKFNIGGAQGGFNNKNKKERECVISHDTARKFFRDTDPIKMRKWHNENIQKFIRHNRGFDKEGIFIVDQTHVVVPDNENYKGAVRMPVDEHGQLIDMSNMTKEQKKAVKYRLCYSMSELLHVGQNADHFIFTGYQWGPGNADDLKQGRIVVEDFVEAVGKGVMKLLIMDKGFICGEFISHVKKDLNSDVLVPLKRNMEIFKESISLAEQFDYKWSLYKKYNKKGIEYTEEVTVVKDIKMWDKCNVPIYVSLMKVSGLDGSVRYWGLCTTFNPKTGEEAFKLYDLRTQIEERHRQIKKYWNINKFNSPQESLVESHVMFTLLTYSLVQLYLHKKKLHDLANKTISTLKDEERLGKNNSIVYSGKYFAVFGFFECMEIIMNLKEEARLRLQKWLNEFKKRDEFRSG